LLIYTFYSMEEVLGSWQNDFVWEFIIDVHARGEFLNLELVQWRILIGSKIQTWNAQHPRRIEIDFLH
jgi:hypothetical protein